MVRNLIVVVALVIFLAVSAPSFAGWTATTYPSLGNSTFLGGASGAGAVGSFESGGVSHAAYWNGTSVVDLSQPSFQLSCAYGCSTYQSGQPPITLRRQVGYTVINGKAQAALWDGTAASYVNLNWVANGDSCAYATDGNTQVGATNNGACMWSGATANTWLNLHPAGYSSSCAYGAGGGYQVGQANGMAAMWTGTASSFVSLNPSGCGQSCAYDTDGTYTVGVANGGATGYADHASRWLGSASSWYDLNPAGYSSSRAYAVSGYYTAGYALPAGKSDYHAGFWNHSMWTDLHSYLPFTGYTSSSARGIVVSGSNITIYGFAYYAPLARSEAVIWQYSATSLSEQAVPEPSSLLALGSGLLGLMGLIRRRK